MLEQDIIVKKLLALAKVENLPNCTFKKGTNLYESVLMLSNVGSQVGGEESATGTVKRWLEEITDDYTSIDAITDVLSDAFVTNILATKDTLKEIHSLVESLTSSIQELIDTNISLDSRLTKLITKASIEHTYNVYDFSMLKLLGGKQDLIAHIESQVINSDDMAEAARFHAASNKYLAATLSDVTPSDIAVDKDLKEKLIDTINTADKDTSRDMVRDTFNLLISGSKVDRAIRESLRRIKEVNEPNDIMFWFTTFIAKHCAIINKVEESFIKEGVDIGPYQDNMKALTCIMELGAYIANYHLSTTFVDTVLFRNGMRNPNNVDAADEANVTDEDIAHHIKYIMKDVGLGTTGLTLKRILEHKASVTVEVEKTTVSDNEYILLTTNNITRDAVVKCMYGYYEDNMHKELLAMINHKANKLIKHDIDINDVVYNIVIKAQYSDTLLEAMYTQMGIGYVRLLANNTEITETMVTETNICIYAKFISDFVVKKFVD